MFEDTFDGENLKDGWAWIRESAQTWRLKDDTLEIRIEPGRGETVKNVLWREAPVDATDRAYAFEVTVSNKTPPSNQWEQAGLIFYRGGEPVVKLGKEFEDGKVLIIPSHTPIDAETVRLRLVVRGDDYVAQYQPDAKGEFKTAARGKIQVGRKIPAAGKIPGAAEGTHQISIQSFEGPADAEHWIRFDGFRIVEMNGLPAGPE